jgi:ADP-heptose:LPS heptosyltransferase
LAKPSQDFAEPLLVIELWGLGDLALAMPFLKAASGTRRVALLAKAHAAPLLGRFAPEVEHIPLDAPWTAFAGKYGVARWPWKKMGDSVRELRRRGLGAGVSARSDPRDHVLLALSGAARRLGFPRSGSSIFLSDPLPPPAAPHRAERWSALAARLAITIDAAPPAPRTGNRVLIHAGAARAVRMWPRARFEELAAGLGKKGWETEIVDDSLTGVAALIEKLDSADRFIGNDSGPGHIAALLGVPTFTVFGPQLPELFAPRHPKAAWIEGAPCEFKPCWDSCHYPEPRCILAVTTDSVSARVGAWLNE